MRAGISSTRTIREALFAFRLSASDQLHLTVGSLYRPTSGQSGLSNWRFENEAALRQAGATRYADSMLLVVSETQ